MKTSRKNRLKSCLPALAALLAVLAGPGCSRQPASSGSKAPQARLAAIDPLAIALTPHVGTNRIDAQVRDQQARVRSGIQREAALEQLGWLYVAKARTSFDAGFYTLAEQCGRALEKDKPGNAAALLLRGHALHSQHRFTEAESIARQVVAARGLAADHGLLGDILMDVGRVAEAGRAYQAMLDLKPDPQGYARAAHVRWINGDLEGAIEIMRMAAAGSSMRDAESAAWMHVQLARYLWHADANHEVSALLDAALMLQPGYPPALLLRGRMLLAAGNAAAAVSALGTAAGINPLPEYQWTLAEALRAAGRPADASSLEREIVSRGPSGDARSCSLFLATRRENPGLALTLARQEFSERADVFSHDALAWALAASGDWTNAAVHMQAALVHGTPEPRLWLHAGVIAFHRADHAGASRWLQQAETAKARLLPGEWERLREVKELLAATALRTAL